jgi:Protein of unknown function (DUF3159)
VALRGASRPDAGRLATGATNEEPMTAQQPPTASGPAEAEREVVADLAPELAQAAERLVAEQVLPAEPDDAVDTDEAGEADEEKLPSFSEQLADQLGGLRGLIESGIPVLVFVVANILWALRPAILVAAGSAVAIAVYRLTRKESIRHAINGLFGIAVGAIIAWKTGSAKNFYLPGILLSTAYGIAMLASIPLRVPLVGWVWALLTDRGSSQWRSDRGLVRTFSWLTALWAATYLAKTGIQAAIFQATSDSDPGTALGIARLVLGYPPYLLLIAVTVWVVRRRHPKAGTPAEPAA